MKVIYKYELKGQCNILELPLNAKVLCAMNQRETMQIWVEIDLLEDDKEERIFEVHGTGHDYLNNPNRVYINSISLQSGTFIFHVFEVKK